MTALCTAYEGAGTEEEIREKLYERTRELLSDISALPKNISTSDQKENLLDALADLNYSDLRHHPHPVIRLSDICRLLIRKGDLLSFRRCFRISHTIYRFKCRQNESWYVSHLYKGISQIGMKLPDTGISNVLFSLSDNARVICPEDRNLGYWAIMSAAVANRNLKMALEFAHRWQQTAQQAGLAEEIFRSQLIFQIFHLLYGDREKSRKQIKEIMQAVPEAWQGVCGFLGEWTQALCSKTCLSPDTAGAVSEPYPLFTGFEWFRPGTAEKDQRRDDFAFLCKLRRNYCNRESIRGLPAAEIECCAAYMALWELPGPLHEFEQILKDRDAGTFHRFSMTRLLGKYRTSAAIQKALTEPHVKRKEDAVLLTMDIRKFSGMCEEYPPEKIFEIINPLFKIMNEEMEKAQGTIIEFGGDCIILAFNTFDRSQTPISDIIYHTVRSIRKLRLHSALSLRIGLPELKTGVGIAKGSVAVGYVGGLSRCHMTLIGNAINLSTRIESESKDSPSEILISRACFDDREPDVWTEAEKVNYFLRDLGFREIKNMQAVHVYGISPLLRYRIDFVPMGFVAEKEEGVVYIDTGNAICPGVIDHHRAEQEKGSACALLLEKPELLLDHIRDIPEAQIEFRLHSDPDTDCAATLYLAFELMAPEKYFRRQIMEKLAEYISRIDQGQIPEPENLEWSLYGIFMVHRNRMKKKWMERKKGGTAAEKADFILLESGLRVIDAAVCIMEHEPAAEFSSLFRHRPGWFCREREIIAEDRLLYETDLSHPRCREYTAPVRMKKSGEFKHVRGLWLENPQSAFFKLWARNEPGAPGGRGYRFLAVDWSAADKKRFVISVDPESGTDLKGLGPLLEAGEKIKREMLGRPRPRHPVRPPSDNSDPWYFGQGHHYTLN